MARIIAIVRTRNEARNIDRFCKAYWWADKVLVADGGSDDDTVSRAGEYYPHVNVKTFPEKLYRNGLWRNPHGKHYNFLIDWAISEGADWIVHDDCDCVPTVEMQKNARGILESLDSHVLSALIYRIYVYGNDQYFPKLNDAGHSLWGFRAGHLRFSEDDPWTTSLVSDRPMKHKYEFERPNCNLHFFCPDEETTQAKLDFYRGIYEIPNAKHPLEYCGPLKSLEPWMVVE